MFKNDFVPDKGKNVRFEFLLTSRENQDKVHTTRRISHFKNALI